MVQLYCTYESSDSFDKSNHSIWQNWNLTSAVSQLLYQFSHYDVERVKKEPFYKSGHNSNQNKALGTVKALIYTQHTLYVAKVLEKSL